MNGSGYGQTVWLYNVDDEGVYLLAHLNSYDKKIAVGKNYLIQKKRRNPFNHNSDKHKGLGR